MPPFKLIIMLCLLALVACKADPGATAPTGTEAGAATPLPGGPVTLEAEHAEAIAEAEAPLSALGEFRIVSVLMGTALDGDRVVIADKREFASKDKIHASVLSTGAHQGLRLSAKWLAPDGSTVAEASQPMVPTTATAITFTISNPEPWPAGDYQLLIAINDQTQRTETFRVR